MKIMAILIAVVALVSGANASDNASNSTAALSAPANVTETLHRIESSTVRREVEAAGFKFDSESSILANPADPRTADVFDQTIRGHTDQFILKFRKPGAENP
jgi:predicted methyltransferase